MGKIKSPFEKVVEEQISALDKAKKMDDDLAKYGKPTGGATKGMVWTVGDMQRYFRDQKRKR